MENIQPETNMNEEGGSSLPSLPPAPPPSNFAVPGAIVIAGALIAFAVYSSPKSPSVGVTANQGQAAVASAAKLRPVDGSDHILGNPNADVKIVEYSDTECPFCKRFHTTLKQAMDEYGKDGRVAWVYRHLPLDALHSKARKESEATECVRKLGGNEKFWAYLDSIFEITPSNNGLDESLLPKLAGNIGIDKAAFESCLASGEFASTVSESVIEATKAGAEGTPYTLVIAKNGKQFPINGALPYASVKQTIETALAEK
jgi:protein-disulfide isomerase